MSAFRPDGFDTVLSDTIAERNDGEIERRRNARHHAADHRHADLEGIGGTRFEVERCCENCRAKRGVGIGHVCLTTTDTTATLPSKKDWTRQIAAAGLSPVLERLTQLLQVPLRHIGDGDERQPFLLP